MRVKAVIYLVYGLGLGVLVLAPLIMQAVLPVGYEIFRAVLVSLAVGSSAALLFCWIWLMTMSWGCAPLFRDMLFCPWCRPSLYAAVGSDDVEEVGLHSQSVCWRAWLDTGLDPLKLPARWKIVWTVCYTVFLFNALAFAILSICLWGAKVQPFAAAPPDLV